LLIAALIPYAAAQPPQGNWVVSGTQVVQNETIVLNGNLTILAGGNLTLEKDTLMIASQYDGQYGIEVRPGGSLYIYGGSISTADKNRFSFIADGDHLVINGSTIDGAGWCPPGVGDCAWEFSPKSLALGLVVQTPGAVIDYNLISHSGDGLILTGSNDQAKGNRIEGDDYACLILDGSSGVTVSGNTCQQDIDPVRGEMAFFRAASDNIVTGNSFEEQNQTEWNTGIGMDAIKLVEGSNNNLFYQNTIVVSNTGITLWESSGTKIVDNSITFAESAVTAAMASVDLKIANNTMSAPLPNTAWGINLDQSYNSLVTGNAIAGTFLQGAIVLDHTNNSGVIDNSVHASGSLAALVLSSSGGNTFLGNGLYGGKYGMFLTGGSDGNHFEDNSMNGTRSAVVVDSDANVIFGNNLYDAGGSWGGPYDNGANAWSSSGTGNFWSYLGGQHYNRTSVPPNGVESSSLPSAVALVSHQSTMPPALAFPPVSEDSCQKPTATIITRETTAIVSGCLSGDVTITDSVVTLGSEGPVLFQGGGALTIKNSRILDGGFGYSFAASGFTSFTILNSTLQGAYMQDLYSLTFDLENSSFVNSQGAYGLSVEFAQTITVSHCSFVDDIRAIDLYQGNADLKSINIDGSTITNTLDVAIHVTNPSAAIVKIVGNDISSSWSDAIKFGGTGGATIANNTISYTGSSNAINAFGDENLITGNKIFDPYGGITVSGNGDRVESNDIVGGGASIAIVVYDSGNLVMQNNVTNYAGPIPILVGGDHNIICHNNFVDDTGQAYDQGQMNQWSCGGEGNYWSNYVGKDSNLDGIGDTPYSTQQGVVDSYPFMEPNGWLTKFYLTVDANLPSSAHFTVNGTVFNIGNGGITKLRLGYVASYIIALPDSVSLSNGSSLVFAKWEDGQTTPTRTVELSSNSTLSASYAMQVASTSTTSTSSMTSTTKTSSMPTSITSSASATPAITASTTSSSTTSTSNVTGGGGIPEFPAQVLIVAAFVSIVAVSYLLARSHHPATVEY
jgi:parallel beta-helix repeat protein